MSRNLKATSRFGDLLELMGLSIQLYSQPRFITVKGDKEKSAKGKGKQGECGGNQAWACKSPFSVEPQRVCTVPPASHCDSCEMSTRKAYLKLSAQGFDQRLITQAPSAQRVPQFQTPEGKQVSSLNHVVCTNSFRLSELFLLVLGMAVPSQSPCSSPRPIL